MRRSVYLLCLKVQLFGLNLRRILFVSRYASKYSDFCILATELLVSPKSIGKLKICFLMELISKQTLSSGSGGSAINLIFLVIFTFSRRLENNDRMMT